MMFLYEIVAAVGIAVATVVSPAPPVVESCYVQSVGGFRYETCHVVSTSVDVAVWGGD